jgi:YD repeat-containing protein
MRLGRAHSEASISLHLAERAIRGRSFSLGDYGHPGYGVVSVAADGSGFKLEINKIAESVAHLHYDVFQVPDAPFDPFAKLKVSFFSDANGDISTLALPLETNVKDVVFTRLPDQQLTARSVIEAFTGQYEIPGSPTPLTISLRGDHTLVVTFPGAPDLELLPKRGTAFEVKDQSGVTIEFKRDASGRVAEAALNDNGTAIVLKKK